MTKMIFYSSALLALSVCLLGTASIAQNAPQVPGNDLIHMPLPKGGAVYENIDGKHLWRYVVEQAKISTDYRDNGHPQWWGRIVGTSGDEADVQWLLSKYRQIGLADAHAQTVKFFRPQYEPKSWSVAVTGGNKAIKLVSAQPPYGATGTDGKELDLEVAYVGLASEADFAGRDVRGKAVLYAKELRNHNLDPDVVKRIMSHGAAAIFAFDLGGENHKTQAYPTPSTIPTFNLGTEDGKAIRDLIGASAGVAPHLKFRLDVERPADQKSYLVWGTLPGATDETVYVVAHRDGWFEGSGDNASGIAVMLGLAEHYAKMPKSQRRRTMVFIGTDGHHDAGTFGETWLIANRARFFSKTALLINAEHPAEIMRHGVHAVRDHYAGSTTTVVPNEWYAGGESRPQLTKIAGDAFREFGVPVWEKSDDQRLGGGDMVEFSWFVPGVTVESNDFDNMHTDADSPETVAWTGLEAMTRAYAKIIDRVNTLPLRDLQRPEDASAARRSPDLARCQAWVQDSAKDCSP
jgi:hypothetical protein